MVRYIFYHSASPGGLAISGERKVTGICNTKKVLAPFFTLLEFIRPDPILKFSSWPFRRKAKTGAVLGSRPGFVGFIPRGRGWVVRSGLSGASPYRSANLAACLNISTNIFRVSFPVCVF
jgi:hypothetical protein